MSEMLKKLKDLFEDPKFIEETRNYFAKKLEIKERNKKRIKLFFSDDNSFDALLLRIIEKHDDRWVDVCYKNGVMPYPWEIFYALLNIVEDEGEEVNKALDEFTSSFPSTLIEYKGWTFAWTHGQGTCLSVYDKNKNLIYRE